MPLELKSFQSEHGLWIITHDPRVHEVKHFNILGYGDFLDICEKAGPGWTLFNDDKIVGCGGITLSPWRKGTAWLLLSQLFYSFPIACFRAIKKNLVETAKKENLVRVEAFVRTDEPKSALFIERFGFELEGRLRSYGPSGEDLFIFARIF